MIEYIGFVLFIMCAVSALSIVWFDIYAVMPRLLRRGLALLQVSLGAVCVLWPLETLAVMFTLSLVVQVVALTFLAYIEHVESH